MNEQDCVEGFFTTLVPSLVLLVFSASFPLIWIQVSTETTMQVEFESSYWVPSNCWHYCSGSRWKSWHAVRTWSKVFISPKIFDLRWTTHSSSELLNLIRTVGSAAAYHSCHMGERWSSPWTGHQSCDESSQVNICREEKNTRLSGFSGLLPLNLLYLYSTVTKFCWSQKAYRNVTSLVSFFQVHLWRHICTLCVHLQNNQYLVLISTIIIYCVLYSNGSTSDIWLQSVRLPGLSRTRLISFILAMRLVRARPWTLPLPLPNFLLCPYSNWQSSISLNLPLLVQKFIYSCHALGEHLTSCCLSEDANQVKVALLVTVPGVLLHCTGKRCILCKSWITNMFSNLLYLLCLLPQLHNFSSEICLFFISTVHAITVNTTKNKLHSQNITVTVLVKSLGMSLFNCKI